MERSPSSRAPSARWRRGGARSSNGRTDEETGTVLAVRVTNCADKPLGEVVPGLRRAIYFDAPEGSAQLSFGAAEVDPGKSIPVHRHKVADRYVEEAFFVLDGEGEVRVGDETRPIRAGSFCVMSPAEGFP